MRKAESPTAMEVTQMALDDAAALIELLRARVGGLRHELHSAKIDWIDAGSAKHLASELLHVASMHEYDATTEEETTRQRVLEKARAMLARAEGRAS